ncbi:hypothetical protein ANOM_005214 [Aspergillus nomiae NRRL 13137]|uniref:Uncharacterized protein n=1 Tax=Aspergillus nomiae NRRL (strain ATCC 15546 / NRRL 13137 / CBS 260.88 / M93) TaxID=1509407 RepID=A0A0L1J3R1_ASPN3|nr:uncharacterized protein ANOM_005214 [Aspergillus nomiae NRRL 13137]KNG86315.1 hypothetical protein ANOM_005214 [Aspergillus nomiae NRRL 13137]
MPSEHRARFYMLTVVSIHIDQLVRYIDDHYTRYGLFAIYEYNWFVKRINNAHFVMSPPICTTVQSSANSVSLRECLLGVSSTCLSLNGPKIIDPTAIAASYTALSPATLHGVGPRPCVSQVNFYMKQNYTRYGFIITDRELVAIRRLDRNGNLDLKKV